MRPCQGVFALRCVSGCVLGCVFGAFLVSSASKGVALRLFLGCVWGAFWDVSASRVVYF